VIVFGVDVHKQSLTAVAVDEAGRMLDERTVTGATRAAGPSGAGDGEEWRRSLAARARLEELPSTQFRTEAVAGLLARSACFLLVAVLADRLLAGRLVADWAAAPLVEADLEVGYSRRRFSVAVERC
jgi:hypothetical protein